MDTLYRLQFNTQQFIPSTKMYCLTIDDFVLQPYDPVSK